MIMRVTFESEKIFDIKLKQKNTKKSIQVEKIKFRYCTNIVITSPPPFWRLNKGWRHQELIYDNDVEINSKSHEIFIEIRWNIVKIVYLHAIYNDRIWVHIEIWITGQDIIK